MYRGGVSGTPIQNGRRGLRSHQAAPADGEARCFGTKEDSVSGYSINIEQKTLENDFFREVLYTAKHLQLVVMTLQVGEEIGQETHNELDQFIRVEAGQGEAILDGERHPLSDGMIVVIPAGAEHNVINTSPTEPLRLYTIYAPPEHPEGTINRTKADAVEYDRQRHH
jgi:mannose-6-phosphate isomerase-like protein (cupin superfamily)